MVSIFTFHSCNNILEGEDNIVSMDTIQRVSVNMNVKLTPFDPLMSVNSRATALTWKDGDVIYLQYATADGNTAKGVATYHSGSWTASYDKPLKHDASTACKAYYFDGKDTYGASVVTLEPTTGVYADLNASYNFPMGGNLSISCNLTPQTSRIRFKGTNGTSFSLSGVTWGSSFELSSATLRESQSANVATIQSNGYSPYIYGVFANPEQPQLVITEGDAIFKMDCSGLNMFSKGKSGYLDLPTLASHSGWELVIPVTNIKLDHSSIELNKGKIFKINATVFPDNATDASLVWTSSNEKAVKVEDNGSVIALSVGKSTVTATSQYDSSKKASCEVNVIDAANGHEYVDLALPSGILWATCNVGATTPSEYGNYYAWGETKPKEVYTTSNYIHPGTVAVLPLEKDAAQVNWGGKWRMPTPEEFQEIHDECTWTWTTLNGKYGYKAISKRNGNSIFLPAAGWSKYYNVGTHGYYWSSTSNPNYMAEKFDLYFYEKGAYFPNWNSREHGQSVRAVLPAF